MLQSPVKQRHQPAVRGRGGTAAAAACPASNFVTKASIDFAKRSCPDSNFVTKVSTFVTKVSTDFAKRSCPDTKASTFVTKASTFVTKVSTLSPRRSTLPPRRSIAPVTSPVDVAIAVLISVVDALVDAMSSFLSACQWNVRGLVRSRVAQKAKERLWNTSTSRLEANLSFDFDLGELRALLSLSPGTWASGSRKPATGCCSRGSGGLTPATWTAGGGCCPGMSMGSCGGRPNRPGMSARSPSSVGMRGPRAGSCRAFRSRGDWRQDCRGWN